MKNIVFTSSLPASTIVRAEVVYGQYERNALFSCRMDSIEEIRAST